MIQIGKKKEQKPKAYIIVIIIAIHICQKKETNTVYCSACVQPM